MPTNINIGDKVFIPASLINENTNKSYAMIEKEVREITDRSVIVDGGKVAKSKCYKNIGTLILNIGDLQTETTLLDPLSKSVLQFIRLMLPDDCIRHYKIRTRREMELIIYKEHGAYSYIILIGHGTNDGILFSDGKLKHNDIKEIFDINGINEKIFISLSCKTGYKAFGGNISSYDFCKSFIAPFHSIHGATASQFVQTFFSRHFILGETIKVAFKNSRKSVPGSVSFRLWENGHLIAGQKS